MSKGIDEMAKTHSMETLLAQKRVYQKHLRNMQQSSLTRNILQGTCRPFIPCQFKFQKSKIRDLIESWLGRLRDDCIRSGLFTVRQTFATEP